MRVLQIMECTIGGTRRHLRDLVAGLRARDVEVEVVCAALREPRMREDMQAFTEAGVRVHELPMVRRISPVRDAWHALRLAGTVLDRGFDVIHTHSSKAGALGRGVGLLLSGAVRVHTPHTFAATFDGKGQGGEAVGPKRLVLATERLFGKLSARVIHVSEAERREGQAFGIVPPGRDTVVHNGIDPAALSGSADGDAVRRRHDVPLDAPLVGSVGLFNDAKGHDQLVAALAELPDHVHVLLVGHGELEPDLRRQAAELGVADRVHITGWIDDVAGAYAAMDLFCLPSRWEGLSYALLEAMAAGKACVSTDVNGSREALTDDDPAGEAGEIVPCGDVMALAAAITGWLANAARRREAGRAARRRVETRFTVDAMVDRTLAVYADALGDPRAARVMPPGLLTRIRPA